ncbi:SUMF1/EgtB/PvdO family nonheme iron enzyme [Myxococcus sp. K38C18041901]|uniref:nSTAND1 domain-containing NTPase n=1 Tax=Myxococcus guangdongensis TaxID=2906760 RepID=UPI0020A7CE43|nr:SUMF1/EgtB/PvdO family nonheme iron enzyme [Myxococcus guangdongensis]MCP3058742.1 SUMF1/EgtB/PvdO family nonheme iron enzyme [Myxococcus guangdongensis]
MSTPPGLLEPPREFEEYQVLRPLGRGAMGQVFLARDTLLDRLVAVKFIATPAGRLPDAGARARFFQEARAIARLQHPNVVAIHRVGEVRGQPYLVSELIRGETLDTLSLPVEGRRLLALAIGLARGLAAAHRRGVLHRDLKPANAILSEDGEVKLLDFGLAEAWSGSHTVAQEGPRATPDTDRGAASRRDTRVEPARDERRHLEPDRAARTPEVETRPMAPAVPHEGVPASAVETRVPPAMSPGLIEPAHPGKTQDPGAPAHPSMVMGIDGPSHDERARGLGGPPRPALPPVPGELASPSTTVELDGPLHHGWTQDLGAPAHASMAMGIDATAESARLLDREASPGHGGPEQPPSALGAPPGSGARAMAPDLDGSPHRRMTPGLGASAHPASPGDDSGPGGARDGVAPAPRLTVPGTPLYLAPELWRGEPASRATDIYAMGVMLHELCTGGAPHQHVPLAELGLAVTARRPPLLEGQRLDLPAGFASVVDRCLALEADQRFDSGDALREALEALNLPAQATPLPSGNPYRGLRAFEAEHRAVFFGREAELREVMDRLRGERFVLLAGDSGVGKSSLCRAGVLPALTGPGSDTSWDIVSWAPGRRPLESLAAALAPTLDESPDVLLSQVETEEPGALARALRRRRRSAHPVLLFIDQLEELVTFSEPSQVTRLAEELALALHRVPRIRVLATARSDCLTRLVALPGLGDELPRALYLVRALTERGLRDAVEGPARALGVRFESTELVDALVTSATRAEGGLPSLQFVLEALWEARDVSRGLIPMAALTALGGVEGALARHADAVVDRLRPEQRPRARELLLELVTSEGTRLRRTRDELLRGSDDDAGRAVLDGLVRGRLLTASEAESGEGVYTLAHESLLTHWDTLRGWLGQDEQHRAIRHRLSRAATEWERLGRPPELLYAERQLSEAAAANVLPGARLQQDFLARSRQVARQRRVARWAVAIAAPLALLAVVAVTRVQSRAQLDSRISQHLNEAQRHHDEARAKDARAQQLRQDAFTLFDTPGPQNREAAETLWTQVQEEELAVETLSLRAQAALETAWGLDPGSTRLNELLADLLAERVERADRQRQPEVRAQLLARLAAYDTGGQRQRRLDAPARISLVTSPPGARVTLLDSRTGSTSTPSAESPRQSQAPANGANTAPSAAGHANLAPPASTPSAESPHQAQAPASGSNIAPVGASSTAGHANLTPPPSTPNVEGPHHARDSANDTAQSGSMGASRNQPSTALLGLTPLRELSLPAGSHLLLIEAPGRVPVRVPILLRPGESLSQELTLPEPPQVPEGFVYIPPGRFLQGAAENAYLRRAFFFAPPLHEVETGAYLIARHEVTFGDYIAFLETLSPEERAARMPGSRRRLTVVDLSREPDGRWRLNLRPASASYSVLDGEPLRYGKRDRRAEQNWLRFPVSAISFEDALAYVTWLDHTGRVPGARVCTEHEWERAARGADGRRYPSGDWLSPDDANHDVTYGREPWGFGPDEVGSHPGSRSPFGVDDLAGNVWEWTRSSVDPSKPSAQGGSWYQSDLTAHSANRDRVEPTQREALTGLRVCATPRP